MALRGEAGGGGNLGQRLISGLDQRLRVLDSTLFDERPWRRTGRCPEGPGEVIGAESGAAGQIANRDRTIDVRLDEDPNPLQGGRRQAAALMASPCRRRLVEPLTQVGEVPLLNLARGSEHAHDDREFVGREGGEHLGATVPQRLPDAIDPLARVRRQFDPWPSRAGRPPRVTRHLQPGDDVADDVERDAQRVRQTLNGCRAFEQQQRHTGQILRVETQDRRGDLIDRLRRFLKDDDLDANLLRQLPGRLSGSTGSGAPDTPAAGLHRTILPNAARR